MTRIEWLKAEFDETLSKKINKGNVRLNVQHFLDCDPTRNKRYTTWLIRTFLGGGFYAEDLSKVRDTLKQFIKLQRRLPVDKRDINSFTSLSEVWNTVSPFVENSPTDQIVSGKQQKRKERDEAYEQSIILFDQDDFKVVLPLTEAASTWWGRGTRWCTSASNDNAFQMYFNEGPLIIFIMPDGRKMQLFVSDMDFQFMDENDAKVGTADIEAYWNYLGPALEWAARQNYAAIAAIPNNHLTQQLCFTTVRSQGRALKFVPREFRNYDLCMAAVQNNGKAFHATPKKLRDYTLCLAAVSKDGLVLESLPQTLIDKRICEAAVSQNGLALEFVPTELITPELVWIAVQKDGLALRSVPEHMQTYDLLLAAVKSNGMAIALIPNARDHSEIFVEAIRHSPHLMYVYSDEIAKMDEDTRRYIWTAAVKFNGSFLQFIDPNLITYDMCLNAVKSNGFALEYVPDSLTSLEICKEAIRNKATSLIFVPSEFENETVNYLHEIERNPKWLQDLHFMTSLKEAIRYDNLTPVTKL